MQTFVRLRDRLRRITQPFTVTVVRTCEGLTRLLSAGVRHERVLLILPAAVLTVSCSGSSSPTAPTSTTTTSPPASSASPSVSSITLTVSSYPVTSITLNVGQSTTVTASVLDRIGSVIAGKTVTWTTSDTNVLNGSSNGNVAQLLGNRAGAAVVTAAVDGVSSQLSVEVRASSGGPSPTPTPTPSPTPSTTTYYVWGGSGYSQYLGQFSCTFCTEYGAESINNLYGSYGSSYSSTSMRNRYGTYGSPYSSYSPCNAYTSTAPRVYNRDRSVYYGVLGGNPYAQGYINSLASWVSGDLCRP